jgi:hypothetical protein
VKRLALLLLLAGCPHPHTGGADGSAVVVIKADVPDAVLWVDGRYIGPVGTFKGGVRLRAGKHRFEVRDDAHFSHYAELDLAPDDRKVLQVHLAPILP